MLSVGPGTMVTPNVRLIEPLGEGGMGNVWVADHLTLKMQVAVKFISPELAWEDPSTVARFTREATAAAQIKSPYVVQTLDHGVMDDGTPYIVMERLEGEELDHRLEQRGPLSVAEAVQVVTQVAKALIKAHRLGIVHRDIKPDNIFLVRADEDVDVDDELFVKVLDFGVAKHTEGEEINPITATGAMVGTPGYMSPEQALEGKNVGPETDQWSLAVVAYHCLTGQPPFDGETLGALCVAISRGAHTPPTQLRPGLPEALDRWFQQGLSVDPAGRFESARELADTFAAAAAASLLPAHPSLSPPTNSSSASGPSMEDGLSSSELAPATPRGRSPVLLGVMVAVTVVVGGVLVVASLLWGGDQSAAEERPSGSQAARPPGAASPAKVAPSAAAVTTATPGGEEAATDAGQGGAKATEPSPSAHTPVAGPAQPYQAPPATAAPTTTTEKDLGF